MDIRKLVSDLGDAKQHWEEVFGTQRKVEQKIIQEEAALLKSFVQLFFPVGEKKEIHADDALLIYEYKDDAKDLISPKVYFSSDNKIKYEVYDEEKYRRFRKNAWIVDGWNIMTPEEFLQYKTLEEVFGFFNERPDVLYKQAQNFVEFNKERMEFIQKIKRIFQ